MSATPSKNDATSHTASASASATISSCNNNNNSNAGQPQTKRQKIEKIKTNSKNAKTPKTTTNKTPPPPDIVDTGGGTIPTTTSIVSTAINGGQQTPAPQHRCSSLSSSANSISTPSSSNNSPTSTPSSSRATSLSQLLNVQSIVSLLPPAAVAVTVGKANCSPVITATSVSNSSCQTANALTSLSCNSSNGGSDHSADEVDRITLPDLLPSVVSTCCGNTSGKLRQSQQDAAAAAAATQEDMREFEASLIKQCLCGVSERTLRKPFQSHYSLDANGQKRIANLAEWPTSKLLQFLSNLQLLFDIYLKQNSKGFICARIMDVCDALIRNDHNLIDEIIVLAGYSDAYVQFLAGRVLAAFLVIAKQELDDDWLKKLVDNLFNFERLDQVAVQKIHFSLEVIKRIVEWKDVDLHPLEDEIVDTQAGIAVTDADGDGSVSSTHAYLHFPTQQPTLETNYFALQFRGTGAAESAALYGHAADEDEGDEDDEESAHLLHSAHDGEEEEEDDDDETVEAHHARHSHHNLSQLPHFDAYASMPAGGSDEYLSAAISSYQQPPRALHAPLYTTAAHHPQAQQPAHYHQTTSYPHAHGADAMAPSSAYTGCHIVTLTDSESFDTTHLKGITIKILENKWPALVKNMSALIANHMDMEHAEHCILNFLQLWENIISVKANLSVVETRPFYAQLDKFELLLNQPHLSCTVYKQMLCLFNEALCYGSTLALQDMPPDETCRLAHQIVRHVKDASILESLPRRQPENIVSLIGFKLRPVTYAPDSLQSHTQHYPTDVQKLAQQSHAHQQRSLLTGSDDTLLEMDKTILQKMVLLVLKSIAVTVKEIRSDSSDSSIDSRDCDAYQDMVLIERSIRDVLRKLESFIKHTLDFHPECHFSKILIHLFDDQDDHLIEAMVCTLDVTAGISFRNNAFPELVAMLNPVYTFLEFLKMISNSSDLLLDLLVNNETCFLLYLLRFLKYIRMNWAMFLSSCHDFGMGVRTVDEAMSVLIRLRLHISRLVARQLYPYDISPVLRLLESCEGLYEGNEESLA